MGKYTTGEEIRYGIMLGFLCTDDVDINFIYFIIY